MHLTLASSGAVYVPAGVTQAQVAANITSALQRASLLAPPCSSSLATLICSAAFQRCASDGLPTPVCPAVCASAITDCAGTPAQAQVAGCAALNDSLGELVFENSAPPIGNSDSVFL